MTKHKRGGTGSLDEISLSDLVPGSEVVAMVARTLGTSDETLAIGLCRQLANIASAGQPLPVDRLNFALAAVAGIEPQDATEALLATQMVAIHSVLLECVRRAGQAVVTDRLASELQLAMQLAKVSALQIETLKRYRSKGEQHIHVHRQQVIVNADQAVVGVGEGDRGNHGQRHQSQSSKAPPAQRGAPLLGYRQEDRLEMRLCGDPGETDVLPARRAGGRTVRRAERQVQDGAADEGSH